jgi:hypothetical protein
MLSVALAAVLIFDRCIEAIMSVFGPRYPKLNLEVS